MARRTLIRGGYVQTLEKDTGDLPGGDVLIENGTIKEIARSIDAGDAEIIDATDRIVMPGFVDTHRHTWQTPVRGVLPSCTLDEYFAGMLDNIGLQYRAEDVYSAPIRLAMYTSAARSTTTSPACSIISASNTAPRTCTSPT